jgi:hypothetical protein
MKIRPEGPLAATSSPFGEKLALLGIVLQIGSLLGIVLVSCWRIHAMSALGAHGPVTLDDLDNIIGRFAVVIGVCLVSFFLSLVLLCISLAVCRCRAAWFFWFLATYSWLLVLMPPAGTAAGIFFLIYSLSRRSEFISEMPISATA